MNPDSHENPYGLSDPDDFQQAWQAHSSQTRVTIDSGMLLKVLQGDRQSFLTVVRLSDSFVIGVSLLMLPVWIWLGTKTESPWTWYLTMPVLVWWAGFTLVYRMRNRWKPDESGGPLLQCVKQSLTEVENQIWYQRNTFWWNLLPLSVSLLTNALYSAWLRSDDGVDLLGHMDIVIFFLVMFFVYYLINKSTEGKHEPRRQELLALLATLGDESTGDESTGKLPAVDGANGIEANYTGAAIIQRDGKPGRWLIVTVVSCLVAVVTFVSLVLAVLSSWSFDSGFDQPASSSGPTGDSLANLISEKRKESNLVGLAAMVMVDGQVVAAAADGERKLGSGVPLEIGDRWHLGGISKSITATMIARLVESGQIRWSDTLGECFPDADMHEDWKSVTLKQLLTDTAGAQDYFPIEVRRMRPSPGPDRARARRAAVLNVISEKPVHPPGAKYVYSSVGYTIAGAMAEKATGATWEDLVKREVFEPLKLTGAGFGPPKSSDDTLMQPRGHRTILRGKAAVNDEADNTPIIGPAATIHMTLSDLCTFATAHLRGEIADVGDLGDGRLLSAETYQLLHKPELSYYAYGWIRKEPSEEVPHTVYWHNGSNTMWYALVAFNPEKNMVVAVTSYDGDWRKAQAAAWEIINVAIKQVDAETEYPKKSPFAAVRWQNSRLEVRLDDKPNAEWLKLVALDELPVAEIVAFSRRTYGDLWQKRFEEDLVELLIRMGHPPKDRVTLVVQSLTSSVKWTREGVPMTEENRSTIRAAARE